MDLSTRQGRREQGLRIQSAVEHAGLSIEDLATQIGCSRALIYQYVSGSTLAQPDRLQQIASKCGVQLAHFYTEEASGQDLPAQPLEPVDVSQRIQESLRVLDELADAQASPPNLKALVATSERLVSLAQQGGSPQEQGRAFERLGNALLSIGEYPGATAAYLRASEHAVLAHDDRLLAAVRQNLGNALLSQGHTAQAREHFEWVANSSLGPGTRWRGLLALGALDEQVGAYQDAMSRFDEAAVLLEEASASSVISEDEANIGLLYVNANRTNVYMDGSDFDDARKLALDCASRAEALGSADQFLEARFNIAWCDMHTARWADALTGLATLAQLARFVQDQRRETLANAWLAIAKACTGDFEAALNLGKEAFAAAVARGDRLSELYAQLALADAYTGIAQRSTEALYHANQALAVARGIKLERAEAEARGRLSTLCEATGDHSAALDHADRMLALASRLGARHLVALDTSLQNAARASSGSPLSVADLEIALKQAQSTSYCDAVVHATAVLCRLPDVELARQQDVLQQAITLLEAGRKGLLAASIIDSILENDTFLRLYKRLAEVYIAQNKQTELQSFLEETGWPPLVSWAAGI